MAQIIVQTFGCGAVSGLLIAAMLAGNWLEAALITPTVAICAFLARLACIDFRRALAAEEPKP